MNINDIASIMSALQSAFSAVGGDDDAWEHFEMPDHNPERYPEGVEVWRLKPGLNLSPEQRRELFKKKMDEVDGWTRWRHFAPDKGEMRLIKPPNPGRPANPMM